MLATSITLEVGQGDSMQTLYIHEDTIKTSSPFFRAAIDKKWQEGRSRTLALPEDEIDTVAAYLDFLAVDELFLDLNQVHEYEACDDIMHAKLYVFCEKVQDEVFCNAVIESFAHSVVEHPFVLPASTAVNIIYSGTPAASPCRQFLVDLFAQSAWPGVFRAGDETLLPPEFLLGVLMATVPYSDRVPEDFAQNVEAWFE